jgi:hypothetical protein
LKKLRVACGLPILALLAVFTLSALEMPRLAKENGRFALMVDGKPFLMLGAQLNNSSSWPSTLPHAWEALAALHANTVEAPVYWEQMEPVEGKFDFSGVDLLVTQAREHHLKVILVWFGTWKNGQNHYVPEWMKSDVQTYPREIGPHGKLLDVMSPNATANRDADKRAFAALMRHVRAIDGTQHTVIMMQVENESGSIGAVRDYSALANKSFAAEVPPELTRALHVDGGTWTKVFGADADERFAAWSTARYINEVALAGKAEYALPMYCNVWITYPVHALENRDTPSAGQEYPSGGPQQANIPIWKIAAPAIDILAPDFYSDDYALLREVLATYHRADNPILIPETHLGNTFGPFLFYALGSGAIGFSPFGIDHGGDVSTVPTTATSARVAVPADNYIVLSAIDEQVARLNFAGKLQTAVEEKGMARQTLHFGDTDAVISFGFPQSDGAMPPGTADRQGRALVAQLGPLEYLVTGFDASVSFHLSAAATARNEQIEILRAEEGTYENDAWQPTRILNGDETDRGLNFRGGVQLPVRIRLHTLPLYDGARR